MIADLRIRRRVGRCGSWLLLADFWGVGGLQPRVARPKSTDSYCFQGGGVSIGKLNFAAPDWILGGWVVLKNKVCNHNYTTPANERGPAGNLGSRRKWSLSAENGRSEPQIARRGAVCQSTAAQDAQGDFGGRTAALGPRVNMAYATVVAGHCT
jgi:hypothetical protein